MLAYLLQTGLNLHHAGFTIYQCTVVTWDVKEHFIIYITSGFWNSNYSEPVISNV